MLNLVVRCSGQVILDDSSFTGTGVTNKEYRLLLRHVTVEEITETGSVEGRDIDLGEGEVIDGTVGSHLGLPVLPTGLGRIGVVIEGETGFREFDLGHTAPERIELFLVLLIVLASADRTTERPHSREDEHNFVSGFLGFLFQLVEVVLVFQHHGVQDTAQGLDHHHIIDGTDVFDTVEVLVQLDVLLEATVEDILADIVDHHVFAAHLIFRDVLHLVEGAFQPAVHVGNPANIAAVDIQHTGTGGGSRGSVSQVRDFEHETHGSGEENTIIGHQGQDLIVVHDRIQGFDPFRIDITVQDTPFVHLVFLVVLLALGLVLHDHGEHTVLPLLGLGVATEQFI